MPFTASHAMAVLPGVRWHAWLRLDPTCLVIGSMAPDFEYFVRGEQASSISHTVVGLVAWNLPVTIALAALWHAVVKWPVIAAMPRAIGRRAAGVFGAPWRPAILAVVSSALLGALTHDLWDGVTHARGWIARDVRALSTVYTVPLIGKMVLFRILQHASSVVGLAVVAWYVARALRRAPPVVAVDAPPRGRVRAVLAGCLALGMVAMVLNLRRMHLHDPGSVISGLISGVLAGTLAASVIARRDARAVAQAWLSGARSGDSAR